MNVLVAKYSQRKQLDNKSSCIPSKRTMSTMDVAYHVTALPIPETWNPPPWWYQNLERSTKARLCEVLYSGNSTRVPGSCIQRPRQRSKKNHTGIPFHFNHQSHRTRTETSQSSNSATLLHSRGSLPASQLAQLDEAVASAQRQASGLDGEQRLLFLFGYH